MTGENSPFAALPRGGVLVATSRGNIQFGIPPETIKDTMKLPGGVPQTFIVPDFMFDLFAGVSVADIEFPIYFNFFIKKGRARVVCHPDQRARIETVLSEALFGPETIDVLDEFRRGEDTPGYPDLKAEMDHFRKMPMAANGFLEMADLVEFCVLDGNGVAAFDGVEIRFGSDGILRIRDAGKELVALDRSNPIIARKPAHADVALDFRPPVFGITTLGAGHGFDPNASTSGIIIWVNRRGIMVDPPVGSADNLNRLGVSPKWIDKVILTHCHADHDAGTLQKILQEGKVNLFTTPTIHQSFLKKSAALTGIEESQFAKLVRFFPVRLGEPMIIDQARFEFNYTLHSIPTISIQASLLGKSMIYSSDTMNDPPTIRQLHQAGVLPEQRQNFLLDFPWDRDVIFHEAGIPPLHTPLSHLCSLPREVRERTYLVHVNPDLIPPESGLRIAPTGLMNTIELVAGPLSHEEAIEILDAFGHVEVFDSLSLGKAREVLLISKVRACRAGEVLFRQGDPGDTFCVVMSGEVDIVLDGKAITTYGVGGFFGEKSLFVEENRTASAVARSAARVLCVDRAEMLSLVRGTECETLLRQIAMFQNVDLRKTLAGNPVFSGLTATQKTHLHGIIKPVSQPFLAGEIIPADGPSGPLAYLIKEGTVEVARGDDFLTTLSRGGVFGVRRLFQPSAGPVFVWKARDQVRLYSIDLADLREYLDHNPGVHIRLYNSRF